uniref:Uncharacterized protein n=1 Tax=Solanum lycopersicum TaxID=4081 RepID=A0A3Q7G0U0_SOLLC
MRKEKLFSYYGLRYLAVLGAPRWLPSTTPSTVTNTDWWKETDKKFQAWPRTAGPPVVMNPISRQNYIVKS